MATTNHKQVRGLALYLIGFFLVWSGWGFLLVKYPGLDHQAIIRAGVRLLLWVLPAICFARWAEGPGVLDHLGLRQNVLRGLAVGLVGAVAVGAMALLGHRSGEWRVNVPDFSTWLNPIITAPFAEEIVFRGVAYGTFRKHINAWTAAIISAVLFAGIHLPYWWLSGAKHGMSLLTGLLLMFSYGLLFAGLYQWSRSLWAPLITHWANNFINSVLG